MNLYDALPVMDAPNQVLSYSTIPALLLKEIRIERGMQQADVSKGIQRTHSAWTKVENGQSPMLLETFFHACAALSVPPADVLNVSDKYFQIAYAHGWRIIPGLELADDQAMKSGQVYYKRIGTRTLGNNRFYLPQVLQTPHYDPQGRVVLADVLIAAFELPQEQYVGNQPPSISLSS